jgi:hypothetical protein
VAQLVHGRAVGIVEVPALPMVVDLLCGRINPIARFGDLRKLVVEQDSRGPA